MDYKNLFSLKEAISYDDVMLEPSYTEVNSRTEPDISTEIASIKLDIPIISSPMDTVTETDMAIAMAKNGGLGIIHRFMSVEDHISQLLSLSVRSDIRTPIVVTIGVGESELDRYKRIEDVLSRESISAVLIDVANGHSSLVRETILKLKNINNSIKIIAGNVATYDGFAFLADSGADSIRCGIGSGCFVPGSKVITSKGTLNIEDIQIGEYVLSHTGELKEVINTMTFDRNEEIMVINEIECTKNHEFYVINKQDKNIVNDENIHKYAFWIDAEFLNKDEHLLIDLTQT